MNLGTAQVIRGDARNLPLADNSVDLVVTSPPYFALRSYQDGGEHYAGQIGSEPTPAEFVAALLEVTRECVRVLKPSGSLWVNLGDSYYSGKGAPGQTTIDAKSAARTVRRAGGNPLDGPSFGIQRKSLCGLPWRYALAPLRVPDHLGIDHFAAFPTGWPRRIIQGWSPAGVCVECGEGRRPTTHKKPMEWRPGPKAGGYELDGTTRKVVSGTMLSAAETTITGYTCDCHRLAHLISQGDCAGDGCGWTPAPTRPAVILDPFGGTGTTALVAKALGRHGITIDMSADYCRLAQWRTNDRNQLAKVMGVDKAPEPDAEQLDLFTEEPVA